MKKETILIVGAGNVGMRVLRLLHPYARLVALTSQAERRNELRRAGAHVLVADLDRPRTLRSLSGLRFDAVVHLAPPQAHGPRDLRTRNLLRAILPKRPGVTRRGLRFVYVSTTGVYGDCRGACFDESRPVHPATPRARRRVDAERALQRTGRRLDWRTTVLRAPGIYDATRLPVARIATGTPALVEEDDVYTNHIHADDLAALCVAALRSRRGWRVYHACDDAQLRMGAYFDLVADAHGLPRPPRLSAAQIARAIDPQLLSFMRESRRPSNARIKRELRVRLRYPSVAEFLRALRAAREVAA